MLPPPVYIVHKKGKPLVWPVKEDSHAIVSFSKPSVALAIASLTESHYVTHKEWPTGVSFSFKNQVIPTILGVQEADMSEMARLCSAWNLRLLIIDSVEESTFIGELREFDPDAALRISHLNSLWDVSA